MKIEEQGEAIELLNNSLPYSNQMKNIDLSFSRAIYFDWRSARYKLDLDYCIIMKVEGRMLLGDDCSLLMTRLLESSLTKNLQFIGIIG